MEEKDELIEKMRELSAKAENARNEFYAAAVLLADAVVRNRDTIRDLNGAIGGPTCAFIDADERYTKALNEAMAACESISLRLFGPRNRRKGGAL